LNEFLERVCLVVFLNGFLEQVCLQGLFVCKGCLWFLEQVWNSRGNLVGIWWYFLNLIINKLNHFLGIWWEFGGNLVGI
jgi:hypothetical protein